MKYVCKLIQMPNVTLIAGQKALRSSIMAQLMYEVVKQFDIANKPKCLQYVIFSVFEHNMYQEFLKEFSNSFAEVNRSAIKKLKPSGKYDEL